MTRPLSWLSCLGLVACSAAAKPVAAVNDGGPPSDAAASDGGAPDGAPEPPWSGQTVEPGCTVNGCIHAFTRATPYSKDALTALAATGQAIQNGVVGWTIRYMSDGVEQTGSVFVPDTPPPSDGFNVVVMNQFASGVGPPCAPSLGKLGVIVAGVTASRGILTLVPDAAGYGGGKLGVFVDGQISGRAALDGVRAAFHLGPAIGQRVARRAVIAGLSQGGHSTLSAAAQMAGYAPNLEVRGFAAAAPPSDIHAETNGYLGTDPFSWYQALQLHTWQQHFGLSGGSPFKAPYASQVEGWFETQCLIYGATSQVDFALQGHFNDKTANVISDEFLAYARSDSWPADWAAVFARAVPIPSKSVAPIVIWQSDADTTVPKAGTDAYVARLKAAGIAVDYRVVAGVDHAYTALGALSLPQAANEDAVAWIQQRLAP